MNNKLRIQKKRNIAHTYIHTYTHTRSRTNNIRTHTDIHQKADVYANAFSKVFFLFIPILRMQTTYPCIAFVLHIHVASAFS